ncbi:sensor domain-containing protein, partial [Sulfurirhabdus autotrophica]
SLTSAGNIEEINLTAARMLGDERSALLGKPFSLCVEKDSMPIFYAHLQRVFSSQEKMVDNVRLKCKNLAPTEVSMESISIYQGANHTAICRTALIDISQRKALERARFLANFDSLTGLPNRTLLEDRVAQALATAQRNHTQVGVLFLDLDRFKPINDTFGHAVGDMLLQEVANRLMQCVRKVDTVARLGGDEFIVLLPDLNGGEHAVIAVDNILQSMSQLFIIEGHQFKIMPSIGISIYPDDGSDMQTLIRSADAAMYHAKKSPHQHFKFYTPEMNSLALENMTLESKLRLALRQGKLELRYQPQMEIQTGNIIGMEALLRWHDSEFGWVEPCKIIALAEDRGLIEQIFEWVLHTACSQIQLWQKSGLSLVPVAVNVSPIQLNQSGFAQIIINALKETELDPGSLELEITESAVMHNPEFIIEVLSQLKGMGVQLSVDDFGTGFSSLSYLARLPIHKLKIAEPFVRDVITSNEAATIISAIVSLSKKLKLRVIAEGVETAAQLAFLRESGCDEIQGYYLSHPLSAEEYASFVKNKK